MLHLCSELLKVLLTPLINRDAWAESVCGPRAPVIATRHYVDLCYDHNNRVLETFDEVEQPDGLRCVLRTPVVVQIEVQMSQ